MAITEVFRYVIDDRSVEAWVSRNSKNCPFHKFPCTKVLQTDLLGICSFSDSLTAAVVCLTSFLDNKRIFQDAGRLAFGDAVQIGMFPEDLILKVEGKDGNSDKNVEKTDFLLGMIEEGKPSLSQPLRFKPYTFQGRPSAQTLMNSF